MNRTGSWPSVGPWDSCPAPHFLLLRVPSPRPLLLSSLSAFLSDFRCENGLPSISGVKIVPHALPG